MRLGSVIELGPRLRVGQVIALVVVQRQAEAALVLAQVVSHEVWVFCQVNRLQRQPPQPLPSVNRLHSCTYCIMYTGSGAQRQRDITS